MLVIRENLCSRKFPAIRVYDVKGRIRERASSHSLWHSGIVLSGTKITFSVKPVKNHVQYDY